ncbi:tail fiber assembly protein, partial [Escherichia coli]|uniref:tail fiber assembly protein n=1 Tax=Escherichia coli TaxID=562 RepID=UPI001F49B5FE
SDGNGSHASTLKSPSYTKSVSWQHHQKADSEISWRQDAVDADIATDEETSTLTEWKKYRVLLMRVDTSTAPDIEWPTPPAVQAR